MSEPRVSFVVPVYNPPLDIFQELLDCFVRQSEPRWECVLVDDASPSDAVREVLAARAAQDARFTVVLRPANGGIAAATNDGIDVARAPIIAFTDHDDLIDDTAVAELVNHFDRHPNDGLVYTDERVIHADGVQKYTYPKPRYSPIRHLGQNYVNHITAFRKALIADLRVRTSFEPAQDSDFVHRAIEQIEAAGGSIGHIPKMLYSWRAIDASSALDAGVKMGMFDSSRGAVEATIERLGLDITATTIVHEGRPTPNQRLDPPPVGFDEIEVFELTTTTTPTDINAAVSACARRFLALVPPDVVESQSTAGWTAIVASDSTLPAVVAAGPLLVRSDRNVLSVGRTIELGLEDPYWNHPLSGGPMGTWLVAREVTAVAPECAVINVDQARRVPPLPEGVRLDVALTIWSTTASQRGLSTIITPRAEVVLDRVQLLEQADNLERTNDFASIVREVGSMPTEAYSASDPVGICWYPTVWEVARHLVEFEGVRLISVGLEDGLVAHRSTADPTWVLDPAATETIAIARSLGARVCVVGHHQSSTDAIGNILATVGLAAGESDVLALSDTTDPTGSLRRAWQQAGVDDPRHVVHLGAEIIYDLTAAAEAGAVSLLLDNAPAFAIAPRPGPHLAAWIDAGGDDGGLLRLMRATIVGAGDLGRTPGYQLGVTLLGPLVVAGWSDDVDHPTVRSLLANVSTQPGDPASRETAPFVPGDVRSGSQEAARRAIREFAEPIAAAAPPWHDASFRDALIADAIDAVEHPNELLRALLTFWSDGRYDPAAVTTDVAATSTQPIWRSTLRRARSRLVRRQRTSP